MIRGADYPVPFYIAYLWRSGSTRRAEFLAFGLPIVEITTDPDNLPSQRVIEVTTMAENHWKLRARVFLQRLWQPTFACIACMTAPTFANLLSLAHWKIAIQTGVGTGVLALLLTFTPIRTMFANRYGNAILVGLLTVLADVWAHSGRFAFAYGEALLTGAVAAAFALAGWYLLEDRARRVRMALAWLRRRGQARKGPAPPPLRSRDRQ